MTDAMTAFFSHLADTGDPEDLLGKIMKADRHRREITRFSSSFVHGSAAVKEGCLEQLERTLVESPGLAALFMIALGAQGKNITPEDKSQLMAAWQNMCLRNFDQAVEVMACLEDPGQIQVDHL